MKLFNLEKALTGEPVKLRNGWKAYVKYVMPELYTDEYPLRGFCIKSNNIIVELCWTMEGKDTSISVVSDLDIISMWEEPRPRVKLDLPAPLKEPQEGMWHITRMGEVIESNYTESDDNSFDYHLLQNGFYFATKEDAEEWINAMKGERR